MFVGIEFAVRLPNGGEALPQEGRRGQQRQGDGQGATRTVQRFQQKRRYDPATAVANQMDRVPPAKIAALMRNPQMTHNPTGRLGGVAQKRKAASSISTIIM